MSAPPPYDSSLASMTASMSTGMSQAPSAPPATSTDVSGGQSSKPTTGMINASASSDIRMLAFQQLIRGREMSRDMADHLYEVLSICEIKLLLDDSDSMTSPIVEEGTDPFAMPTSTRWLELKKLAAETIKFTTVFNPNGIDIYFLNRPGMQNVTSMAGLQTIFSQPPQGGTPLINRLHEIIESGKNTKKKYLLVLVITDGEPTDGVPFDQSRNQLYNVLVNKPSNVHVSFAECTDQADDMNYLDQWKGKIPNFDNTDDYREEAARVKMSQQNSQFKFDYSDYLIKFLLSTFNRWYYNLDVSRVGQNVLSNNSGYNYYTGPQQYMAPAPSTNIAPPTQITYNYNPPQQSQPTMMPTSQVSPYQTQYQGGAQQAPVKSTCCVIL